jgi:hypothetical protein
MNHALAIDVVKTLGFIWKLLGIPLTHIGYEIEDL